MTINNFVLAIVLSFSGSFGVDDTRDIGSFSFASEYDNYSGSFDIYYSFNGTPSGAPSIQIKTLSGVLVNHQMTSNDFYSGVVGTGLISGNIYKYTFDIESIQHTTTYYFNLVNDNNTSISYIGTNINFYIVANIYDFDNDYYNGFNNGVDVGYEQGYEQGKTEGYTNGLNACENFEFNLDWLSSIFSVATDFLNVEIFPTVKIGYIIFGPLVIAIIYKLYELLR